MVSAWTLKQQKKAEFAVNKELDTGGDAIDFEGTVGQDVRDAAMGKGEDELFEKKLSKEEKKALAKAKRDAKKKAKGKDKKKSDSKDEEKKDEAVPVIDMANLSLKERKRAEALDNLSKNDINVTYEAKSGKLHANTKDINVGGVTVTFHGKPLIEETEVVINYGNRYGFIGPNGSGKSTIMKAIAARSIPIPDAIDIYFLDQEYEACEKTALQAVFEVQDEVNDLEKQAEALNNKLAEVADDEEAMEATQMQLEMVYEKLDDLDVNTAEARASTILFGLGFTTKMQGMMTKEFSGGWRMRIALARALFLKPEFLLLDEPTNHLDMDAVLWLEDYLSQWTKILFFVCHSQDFMNNVCTDIVRLDPTYKKLRYYSGNYDTYVQTRRDQDMVQMRQYEAEQRDIAEIKDFIARFGHGTVKMVRQAQSREKLLQKKLEAGLTPKPEEIPEYDWSFPDAGQLPVPVLAIENVSFAYPNSNPLYKDVDFGIDLQTRVALVGPNGAGKTTLFKLICEELIPIKGLIKRNSHLKISRFTQHFEDKLDLEMTPLAFFKEKLMPKEPVDKIRSLLGRYGCTGAMQQQVMGQLSAGQKARIVFAIIAWEKPHLLLLDEPTNPLDIESIDALARCINNFKGGVVMISHDMRLISQCAQEIYICDHKQITRYNGDIMKFKLTQKKENNKRLAQHMNG
ncbi:ATP-binding cassette, subfamily F, member 2 [Chaetoceros tenuissimus]|uniref:ATP-binding cassette, subfamily F, member 2 n=1 Tax=Chaetoceros tenuissimus TaxID=426638 RepID=A0AAD3D6K3_9STRA|nr:ATP-binding cassette, subfamily F, member 2 [Chaetoceros tenuissimus]